MPVLGVRCVCVVKMNVLAESVAGGGAFLAGRESWVGSVQDDEGPRLGRVKTPLQSPHFIPYTKGGKEVCISLILFYHLSEMALWLVKRRLSENRMALV